MQVNDPQENYGSGWIKIFRSIRSHWIWENEKHLKWWMDILLEVNHCGKKVSIGYKLFECSRGQSVRSLQKWSERWGVSKTVVNNFFSMLENDAMIKTESLTVTTRLTVCNYESYQGLQNAFETQETTQKNATEPQQYSKKTQQSTNKNEKNVKNEKNGKNIEERKKDFALLCQQLNQENNYLTDHQLNDEANGFIPYWTEHGLNDKKMKFEKEKSFSAGRRMAKWRDNAKKFSNDQQKNSYSEFLGNP